MNNFRVILTIISGILYLSAGAQWNTNGTHIYNTNTQNVGIGTGGPWTPTNKLHIDNGTGIAGVMAESNYSSMSQRVIGYYRVKNNFTGDLMNISLRKNGNDQEMLQSCFYAAGNNGSGLWREYSYLNYTTGKYELRNGIVDAEFKNSGNLLLNCGGNVGIGDSSPLAGLTVGNGDKFQVDLTRGNVTFTDDLASIKFPSTTGANAPMMFMFSGGTQNADRMVIAHSPGFPAWGLEYKDTLDVLFFRDAFVRRFAFELGSGHFGIGTENPEFPIDIVGRMRIKSDGSSGNRPGIWFAAQDNEFDRALLGMSEPDSVIGIWSQHLNKWAIEFEIMREPRIGVNIPAGSPPRSEIHLYHTNFGGSNDGVRIQNEGSNGHYWNLYTSNTTGFFEFYKTGIKKATIDATSGVYTAVSDERLKTNINDLNAVLPKVMSLNPKTYQFIDAESSRVYTGLLAQELEKVFPQFVYYGGDDQVTYTVDYASMSVIALKAIQEQQAQIEELKSQIEDLKALINK